MTVLPLGYYYSLAAVDSTETYAYIAVLKNYASTGVLQKCVISTGACTVYLSDTQSIGKQVDGTDIFFLPTTGGGTIDSSDNIYFVGSYEDSISVMHYDLYKCTGVNTCSQLLNGHSFYSMNDDDFHSIKDSSTLIDSEGISFLLLYQIFLQFIYFNRVHLPGW